MPDTSTILSLPYILPAQAQKHVTHNEALRQLDVIVQLAVIARSLAAPPNAPLRGDRYIVAAAASGEWVGKSGQIALFDDGTWQFFAPVAGWTAWVAAESALVSFNGSLWVAQADGLQSFSQIGISATADASNRLAVSSPATLLNHAGAGHQVKVNKATITDTASLLFQTGFSGRAEMGTAGNDDFAIKVSADGTAFVTGLSIAGASGQVTLPAALRLGGQVADPDSPSNGMIWLNSTTGEVKVQSNGTSIVVATPNGISNSQMANMASATFKGRETGTAGAPQDLTAAQAAALLPVFTSAARGLAPASGGGSINFLRADGFWAAPLMQTLGGLGISASASNINAAAQTLQQNRFLGRASAGSGGAENLSTIQVRSMLGLALDVNGALSLSVLGFYGAIAATGWQRTPDGLIEQWGVANTGVSGVAVTFPIAFPTAFYNMQLTVNATSSGPIPTFQSASTTGAFIKAWANNTTPQESVVVHWRALGR